MPEHYRKASLGPCRCRDGEGEPSGGKPLPEWDAETHQLTLYKPASNYHEALGVMYENPAKSGEWWAITDPGNVSGHFGTPEEAAGFLVGSYMARPANFTARPFVHPVGNNPGPLPTGWVAEPIGRVDGINGYDAEIAYDPDRHDVLVARGQRGVAFPTRPHERSADKVLHALTVSGWEFHSSYPQKVWFRDRRPLQEQVDAAAELARRQRLPASSAEPNECGGATNRAKSPAPTGDPMSFHEELTAADRDEIGTCSGR